MAGSKPGRGGRRRRQGNGPREAGTAAGNVPQPGPGATPPAPAGLYAVTPGIPPVPAGMRPGPRPAPPAVHPAPPRTQPAAPRPPAAWLPPMPAAWPPAVALGRPGVAPVSSPTAPAPRQPYPSPAYHPAQPQHPVAPLARVWPTPAPPSAPPGYPNPAPQPADVRTPHLAEAMSGASALAEPQSGVEAAPGEPGTATGTAPETKDPPVARRRDRTGPAPDSGVGRPVRAAAAITGPVLIGAALVVAALHQDHSPASVPTPPVASFHLSDDQFGLFHPEPN